MFANSKKNGWMVYNGSVRWWCLFTYVCACNMWRLMFIWKIAIPNLSSPLLPRYWDTFLAMTFSFYNRSSSKPSSGKNGENNNNRFIINNSATTINHESSRYVRDNHTRNSSRIRIPFLGRRRKSFATLRTEVTEIVDDTAARRGRGHHKTVSELANEYVFRKVSDK